MRIFIESCFDIDILYDTETKWFFAYGETSPFETLEEIRLHIILYMVELPLNPVDIDPELLLLTEIQKQ